MREYTSTDLANNTGDVLSAAAREAVEITRHGKPRFVLMSYESYERMRAGADPRRAVRVAEMDEAERAGLIAALDAELDDG
ncbi:type II toxin-antitoxin system prevent-host-death family antitoxin [Psychromarinibacter sp. C21-152]|uniref:Antitoxin n=1 Tax=Psychromarinibacter sediminicola TaxID=3033385 RepID=A0AAE3NRG5_9RHOB|nr:type II toxin-antitoxin system prevent-host-death family antitoxin [Psychromarinibacter sediminicola]MDF0600732.1 type II toxin-antitoxin system prevent-host-death family antitoxin [Psychromarinibacter sediminicola]